MAGAAGRGERLKSGCGDGLIVGEDALVLVVKALPFLLEPGLELGIFSSLVVSVLLGLLQLELMGSSGLLSLNGQGGRLGSDGFLDPQFDGVDVGPNGSIRNAYREVRFAIF